MTEAIKVSGRLVHRGHVFDVHVDRVLLPHGREVDMHVVRHARSVVLVPTPDDDHVILVRQYRYVVDRWIWELPAGGVEAGEEPEAAARRECHEEVGMVPRPSPESGVSFRRPAIATRR